MNPGYLSYVIISMTIILLASGWKEILFRGLSRRTILLFFIGWLIFSMFNVQVSGYVIRLSAIFLLVLVAVGTWAIGGALQQAHVWCAGLLLGMFDFLMLELNAWNLLLTHLGPVMNSAVILALLTMLLGRNPLWQFVALSAGLLAGEFLHVWLHRHDMPIRLLGGAAFSDHWWFTVGLARGLTAAGEQLFRILTASVRNWAESGNKGD